MYLPHGFCSVQNTTILMNEFNPYFVEYYEPGTGDFIKVSFNNFTTNNKNCFIFQHNLVPSDEDFYLPTYFKTLTFSGNI